MLAHLPQSITTYVTNLLLARLFTSSRNRTSGVNLLLRPCNQVHDETDCFFRNTEVESVHGLFGTLAENEVETWGVKYSIPFEVAYGPDWGNCHEEI